MEHKSPKVFLSGRLKSKWQDKVIKEVHSAIFFDPRTHGLKNPRDYTAWDLDHIASSDIVFAYMENDNPSGYGLATEVGYAKALGKTVILVDEKSATNQDFRRYFALVRETSDATFNSFDEGLAFFKKILQEWQQK